MSVVLATVIIPTLCSRDPSARNGLRRTVVGLVVFNFVYALLVIFVYPRLDW